MTDDSTGQDQQDENANAAQASKPRRSRSRRVTSPAAAPTEDTRANPGASEHNAAPEEAPGAPTEAPGAPEETDAAAPVKTTPADYEPGGSSAAEAPATKPRTPRKSRTSKARTSAATAEPADAAGAEEAPKAADETSAEPAAEKTSAPKKRASRSRRATSGGSPGGTTESAPAETSTTDTAVTETAATETSTTDSTTTDTAATASPTAEPAPPAEGEPTADKPAPAKKPSRSRKPRTKTSRGSAAGTDTSAELSETPGQAPEDAAEASEAVAGTGAAMTAQAAIEPVDPQAVGDPGEAAAAPADGDEPPARTTRRRSRRATAPSRSPEQQLNVLKELGADDVEETPDVTAPAGPTSATEPDADARGEDEESAESPDEVGLTEEESAESTDEGPQLPVAALLFQAPDTTRAKTRRRAQASAGAPTPAEERAAERQREDDQPTEETTSRRSRAGQKSASKQQGHKQDAPQDDEAPVTADADEEESETEPQGAGDGQDSGSSNRRRRRRGGRGRRNRGGEQDETAESGSDTDESTDSGKAGAVEPPATDRATSPKDSAGPTDEDDNGEDDNGEDDNGEGSSSSRRRRRRRRGSSRTSEESSGRTARDEVTALKGSTRLEAKRQRRREGRDAGRRRRDVITEAEFLARREAVNRKMVVREKDGLNQIAVLEDDILVEHYVARHTQTSMVGNVYLGRVQNVLPSMEAAFIDLGKGRNAVLYAGEVNWDAAGMEGQPRRIEQALKSGDQILVQVTKDPIGHKGARLTSQVTLAGRYLVLVPSGAMTGISRKLPDTERSRLKKLLKEIVPEGAGVIVRTAAEGASEEQLRADVERLTGQWADIEAKSKSAKSAPVLLKGEPELAVRVVRDVFNEDFESLVVSGDEAWKTISTYVNDLVPDLADRAHHWTSQKDVFAEHRIDEQLAKGMDRKVWLPSGGSLVIDRTEAMTVVDVNTGKFTGSGGTLEETVTRNNLEAAEEIVRQLRLRDIGGIIVIDFIDMVLESNRDLVLRRLVECLGRDRTRHQVAEVTSLGLVQMTRKRVGQGLVEAFSSPCECCNGRGFIVHEAPVEKDAGSGSGGGSGHTSGSEDGGRRRNKRGGGAKNGGKQNEPAPEPEVDEAGAAAAREAVKATLATIAAAAASAHEDERPGESVEAVSAGSAAEQESAATSTTATDDSRATEPADAEMPSDESGQSGRSDAQSAAQPSVTEPAGAGDSTAADEARAAMSADAAAAGQGGVPEASQAGESGASQAGVPEASQSTESEQSPAGAMQSDATPTPEAAATPTAEPAPARRPRRSRRAQSGGVVTAGDSATPALITASDLEGVATRGIGELAAPAESAPAEEPSDS